MKCCYLCKIPFMSLAEYICKIDVQKKIVAFRDKIIFKIWKFKFVESQPYDKLTTERVTTSICSTCACNPKTIDKLNLKVVKKYEPSNQRVELSHQEISQRFNPWREDDLRWKLDDKGEH